MKRCCDLLRAFIALVACTTAATHAAEPPDSGAGALRAFPNLLLMTPIDGPPPKRLFGDVVPVRIIESLKNVVIPNTTIVSSVLTPSGSCEVTAIVTHPPSGDHVRVLIAMPMKGWNGRFCGTGGGGFIGGMPFALFAPLRKGTPPGKPTRATAGSAEASSSTQTGA